MSNKDFPFKIVTLRRIDHPHIAASGSFTCFDVLKCNFTVLKGSKGLFVSLPRKKGKDEKWFNEVSIQGEELYRDFQKYVLEEYNKGQEIGLNQSKGQTKPKSSKVDDEPW